MYMYCIRFLCLFFCISRYFLLSLYVENNIITTVIIIYHYRDNYLSVSDNYLSQ